MDVVRVSGIVACLAGLVLCVLAACGPMVGQTSIRADAGRDVTVNLGTEHIPLDGSLSQGTKKHPLSFHWEIVSTPFNSQSTLIKTNQERALFFPDRAGRYEIKLTVSEDGKQNSDRMTVRVNAPPVAVIRRPKTGLPDAGHLVLDGSRSFDPEGYPLVYTWKLLRKPNNSRASLRTATGAVTEVMLGEDTDGVFEVELNVNDGFSIVRRRLQFLLDNRTIVSTIEPSN